MKNWANIRYTDTHGNVIRRREHNYVTQAGCIGLITEILKDPELNAGKGWYIGALSSIKFSSAPGNLTTLTAAGYSFVIMDDGTYYVEYSMAPQFLGGSVRPRSQITFDPDTLLDGQVMAPGTALKAYGITHMGAAGEVDSQVNGLFITPTLNIGGTIDDPIAVIIFNTPLTAVGSSSLGVNIYIDYTFDLLGQ